MMEEIHFMLLFLLVHLVQWLRFKPATKQEERKPNGSEKMSYGIFAYLGTKTCGEILPLFV